MLSWKAGPSTGLPCQLPELGLEARALQKAREEGLRRAGEALRDHFGPKATLVKATSVDGRLLFVIDGLVTESVRSHLYECLQGDSFQRTEFARPDTHEFRHHVVEYNPDKLRRTELWEIVSRLVTALFPAGEGGRRLEVYRIYTNAVMFGDAAFVHRDSCDNEHVTALVYPNPEWSSELGGETIFYDEGGEIVEAVEPRPGRLCLFHGSIMHKGSPPGRLFWGARYTTAFKFAPEDLPPTTRQGLFSRRLPNPGDDADDPLGRRVRSPPILNNTDLCR